MTKTVYGDPLGGNHRTIFTMLREKFAALLLEGDDAQMAVALFLRPHDN